jgi:hypothetical protein
MSAPTSGRRHLVLVGATGMVGGYALRYALEHPAVERVTAIGRRTLGISHPKLKEVLHPNFADCSALTALPFPLAGEGWGAGVAAIHTVRVERVSPPHRIIRCDATSPASGRGESESVDRQIQQKPSSARRRRSRISAAGRPVLACGYWSARPPRYARRRFASPLASSVRSGPRAAYRAGRI